MISLAGRIAFLQHLLSVADMLEEMAPDLLRINPSAADTAARILVRVKLQALDRAERLGPLLG